MSIHGELPDDMKWTVIRGAKAVTPSSEISSKLLGLILSNANPKLTTISLSISKLKDDVIPSITPVLTSSYHGIKELTFDASGKVSLDLPKLISITENQPLLHTISISIRNNAILWFIWARREEYT